VALLFECLSILGYIGLLSLVAGEAAPRIGKRESAQITLAGAAATRLLPTAGAGGAALALWALRRAGLSARAAGRTLLTFLVLLYAVFLGSVAVSGLALMAGLGGPHPPVMVCAISSIVALAGIALALALGFAGAGESTAPASTSVVRPRFAAVHSAAGLVGQAVRDALCLVRAKDARLAGAAAYWLFDAAVLWAMLNAFGAAPSVLVIALAYFVGQVANTLPLPGSVSGGMVGMLIAFGAPASLVIPAVLAYRTIAVWLPTPAAAASIPGLRATVLRWAREDTAAGASA
jgi:uncharacterized membrane protein YbhN (UPF0104 family)